MLPATRRAPENCFSSVALRARDQRVFRNTTRIDCFSVTKKQPTEVSSD
jgi:hypothetical protein